MIRGSVHYIKKWYTPFEFICVNQNHQSINKSFNHIRNNNIDENHDKRENILNARIWRQYSDKPKTKVKGVQLTKINQLKGFTKKGQHNKFFVTYGSNIVFQFPVSGKEGKFVLKKDQQPELYDLVYNAINKWIDTLPRSFQLKKEWSNSGFGGFNFIYFLGFLLTKKDFNIVVQLLDSIHTLGRDNTHLKSLLNSNILSEISDMSLNKSSTVDESHTNQTTLLDVLEKIVSLVHNAELGQPFNGITLIHQFILADSQLSEDRFNKIFKNVKTRELLFKDKKMKAVDLIKLIRLDLCSSERYIKSMREFQIEFSRPFFLELKTFEDQIVAKLRNDPLIASAYLNEYEALVYGYWYVQSIIDVKGCILDAIFIYNIPLGEDMIKNLYQFSLEVGISQQSTKSEKGHIIELMHILEFYTKNMCLLDLSEVTKEMELSNKNTNSLKAFRSYVEKPGIEEIKKLLYEGKTDEVKMLALGNEKKVNSSAVIMLIQTLIHFYNYEEAISIYRRFKLSDEVEYNLHLFYLEIFILFLKKEYALATSFFEKFNSIISISRGNSSSDTNEDESGYIRVSKYRLVDGYLFELKYEEQLVRDIYIIAMKSYIKLNELKKAENTLLLMYEKGIKISNECIGMLLKSLDEATQKKIETETVLSFWNQTKSLD